MQSRKNKKRLRNLRPSEGVATSLPPQPTPATQSTTLIPPDIAEFEICHQHFLEVRCGCWEAWENLYNRVLDHGSMAARCVVAICYADREITIVPIDATMATRYGKNTIDWLHQHHCGHEKTASEQQQTTNELESTHHWRPHIVNHSHKINGTSAHNEAQQLLHSDACTRGFYRVCWLDKFLCEELCFWYVDVVVPVAVFVWADLWAHGAKRENAGVYLTHFRCPSQSHRPLGARKLRH
jgi:hypothetical protein